jgi:hypothetical protein
MGPFHERGALVERMMLYDDAEMRPVLVARVLKEIWHLQPGASSFPSITCWTTRIIRALFPPVKAFSRSMSLFRKTNNLPVFRPTRHFRFLVQSGQSLRPQSGHLSVLFIGMPSFPERVPHPYHPCQEPSATNTNQKKAGSQFFRNQENHQIKPEGVTVLIPLIPQVGGPVPEHGRPMSPFP